MNTLPSLVRAIGFKKRYLAASSCIQALKGVDLLLQRGEFVAIMGPSGSGKSTLLQILGCLDTASEGSYLFNGLDVFSLKDEELAALRSLYIGFVFQSFFLIPEFTLYENVALPFLYRKPPLSPQSMREKIVYAIEKVGLKERMYHKPAQLSGGEAQRAAIARAIVSDPLLLLADEPTGNLDRSNQEAVLELFDALHREGVTIAVVTHDEEVANCCQRRLYLQEGRLYEN